MPRGRPAFFSLSPPAGEWRQATRALRRAPWYAVTVVAVTALSMAASPFVTAFGERFVIPRLGAVAVETRAADMFRQPWPTGYDALFFSNVWHDWNVRTCQWLAARAFDALPSGGRILLHEMLLATQGQQFTAGELKAILDAAGFARIDVTHTHPYYSLVTGYKA